MTDVADELKDENDIPSNWNAVIHWEYWDYSERWIFLKVLFEIKSLKSLSNFEKMTFRGPSQDDKSFAENENSAELAAYSFTSQRPDIDEKNCIVTSQYMFNLNCDICNIIV